MLLQMQDVLCANLYQKPFGFVDIILQICTAQISKLTFLMAAPLKTWSQEGCGISLVLCNELLIRANSNIEDDRDRETCGKPSNITCEKDRKEGTESSGVQLLWVEKKYRGRRKQQAYQSTDSQCHKQISNVKGFCCWNFSQRLQHTMITLALFAKGIYVIQASIILPSLWQRQHESLLGCAQ